MAGGRALAGAGRVARQVRRACGALVAAGALAVAPAGAQPRAAQPHLSCAADPAVELFAVLFVLGGRVPRPLETGYAAAVARHFAPVADHPAVRRVRALVPVGATQLAAGIGSRLGPPPALAYGGPPGSFGSGPDRITAAQLRALTADARDFARAGRFAAFLDAQAPRYRRACDALLAELAFARVPERMVALFGVRAAGYRLAPMLLIPRLGVAATGVRAAPGVTLTAYVGPAGVADDGEARFRTGWALERIVLHEFAHAHVGAAVAGAAPALARSAALFAPVRERLWRADRLTTWEDAVTETVVRAAVALARGATAGDSAARSELHGERALGFFWVDTAAAALRAAARTPAPARQAVAATARALARVAAAGPAAADRPFEGGVVTALEGGERGRLTFVLPTAEADRAAQDSLHALVLRMRAARYPAARVLADTVVLARGAADEETLWVLGTPTGNAWLRAHAAALPVRVEPGRVVADSVYAGAELVFVAALPNPRRPACAVVVTVGQRAEPLTRAWWTLASEYAVVDGARVLGRGRWERDGARVRFPAVAGGR